MSRAFSHGDLARGMTQTVRTNPLPYVVPPVAAAANLILAAVLSHTWGAYAHPTVWQVAWRSALLMTCSALIVWTTWRVGRARKMELRAASMLMSAGACIGLFVLTFRPWTGDSVVVYLLLMTCASIMLSLTRMLRGDGTDARPNLFGELGERVKELQDIGKTGRPRTIDGRVVTHIEMNEGGDFGELEKPNVRTAIASAHDIPVGGVRMVRNRNTPRIGRMELSPVDALENPPAWPGLSAAGGSIAAPLRLAVYQTGMTVPLHLTGDEKAGRNAVGVLLLLGQSGSGKTELQIALAAEARSRRNCRVTYIDGRKGMQLPAALRSSLHVFIADATDGETHLESMIQSVSARAALMGNHGHAEWTDGCTKCPPFDLVIVDEASKFVESEEILVELAESIRSVGICMVLGIQRGTGDRLPTSVRSTVGGVICMGVKNVAEAGRVLSESTIAAGADPGWGNKKPGAFYAELPGTDEETWSLAARTFRPDRDGLLAELVEYLAGADEVEPASLPIPAPSREPVPADDDEQDEDPECPPLDVDPECEPDPDPYSPIEVPDRPRIELALEPEDGRQFTPSQIRAMFREAILSARDQGAKQVRPSTFSPLVGIVGEDGLKPPTISKILREFCQPGPSQMLRRSDDKGVYVIVDAHELVGASAT